MIWKSKAMSRFWLRKVKETNPTISLGKSIIINSYGLDPVHDYTAPSWSSMLKMTKQNLELISDIDMLLMIEKAK